MMSSAMTEGRTRDLSGQLSEPSPLATIISRLITVIIILIITRIVLCQLQSAMPRGVGCCLERGDIRLT